MTLQYIVLLAIEKFRQASNIPAEWTNEQVYAKQNLLVGQLALHYHGETIAFDAIVMKEPRISYLFNREVQKAKNVNGNIAVISYYISEKMKQTLEENKISYIDGAGNAFFVINNEFVTINGKETEKLSFRDSYNFTPKELQFLFYLLVQPELISLPAADITKKLSISRKVIEKTFINLRHKRLALKINEHTHYITDKKALEKLWIDAYDSILKPKLHIGSFRFADTGIMRERWKKIELKGDTVWGGEPAAAILTSNLQPEIFTLYTTEKPADLVQNYGLIPDVKGKVQTFLRFWSNEIEEQKGVAPDLLIYADLINTADTRNLEIAKMLMSIYESY